MLLNTFSRNKRQKIVKNQDGSFKVPLFDLKPSECHVRCQNLIGSYASTHSTFNLITPCNKHPNTQSHKATKQASPTLSPQSPSLFPFPPIPYPLPLSTAATQAKYPTKNKTAGSQFACPW